MVRLIQRRLIIPRGDTGSFSIPAISTINTGDITVFTIFSPLTQQKIFEKIINSTDSTITINFTHEETVNLPVGKYNWDIKFYKNPIFSEEILISGEEVDSYYAAYSLPECEIRQTGDNLLNIEESTISTEQLTLLTTAIAKANEILNTQQYSLTEQDKQDIANLVIQMLKENEEG